jgi:hypothetical protein
MPLCVRNSQLCLADPTETIKNNGTPGAVAAQRLVYLSKLIFSCYEMFNVGDRRETKRD